MVGSRHLHISEEQGRALASLSPLAEKIFMLLAFSECRLTATDGSVMELPLGEHRIKSTGVAARLYRKGHGRPRPPAVVDAVHELERRQLARVDWVMVDGAQDFTRIAICLSDGGEAANRDEEEDVA
jgi:hypothetical protein